MAPFRLGVKDYISDPNSAERAHMLFGFSNCMVRKKIPLLISHPVGACNIRFSCL